MYTVTTADALNVRVPAAPRGARLAATLFASVARWLTRPAAPRTLSRAQEAATVRDMARRIQNTDPGFAADLYAAAARHEEQADH